MTPEGAGSGSGAPEGGGTGWKADADDPGDRDRDHGGPVEEGGDRGWREDAARVGEDPGRAEAPPSIEPTPASPVSAPVAEAPPASLTEGTGPRGRRRRLWGSVFAAVAGAATFIGVVVLVTLLVDVLIDGVAVLDAQFLSSFPSRIPERAGIRAAIWGSVWILGLTALISFPLSVGAALYLEEYAPRNRITRTIQTNIANLAGVPSIVYGILGLAVFVRGIGLERSVISGALTLSLLILPVMIMAAQEAVRAVPDTIRQAAYGLGATRWQVVRHQVLPMSLPGILTGTILALSRAVGETAPLIMIGALTFIAFTPQGIMDPFTVLPIQIFNWVSRPQDEFRALAAGAIIVLLVLLLAMNAGAIILRNRYQKRL